MSAHPSLLARRSRHGIVAWLLGALLVLQLALPFGCVSRAASSPQARLAALAEVVGHAVETCHHDDDGPAPVGDPGACCPCALCHVLTATCPAAPSDYAFVRPAAVAVVSAYAQPPPYPRAPRLDFAGPRGPPLLG